MLQSNEIFISENMQFNKLIKRAFKVFPLLNGFNERTQIIEFILQPD